MITIERTVEIPADRRLVIEVPREIPAGRIMLTLTPAADETAAVKTAAADISSLLRSTMTQVEAMAKTPDGKTQSFRGILKGRGITLERFREIRREDKALEDAADERLRGGIR